MAVAPSGAFTAPTLAYAGGDGEVTEGAGGRFVLDLWAAVGYNFDSAAAGAAAKNRG